MGDKKRKSLTSGSDLPKKKTKTSLKHGPGEKDAKAESISSIKPQDVTTTSQPTFSPTTPSTSSSKQPRKRAADFLSDNEDEEAPQLFSSKDPHAIAEAQQTSSKGSKKRKAKKAKREAEAAKAASATSLTADAVNGFTEEKAKSKNKTTTKKKPAAQSMQAEAQPTTDQELEDERGSFPAEDKARAHKGLKLDTTIVAGSVAEGVDEENDAALLAGFDSDTSDIEDQGWDGNLPDVPLNDQGHSNLEQVKSKDAENERGTMYIGRLPHGFYENEMRAYFGQFGEITELRLARNKRTGASKHFAFIEFASSKVCKIAVETMNAYLLYGHILKCSFIPQEDVPAGIWKGSNRKFRKIPHVKIEREKLAAPKSAKQWEKKNLKEQKKRDKNAKKLKDVMDYDAPEPKLRDPKDAVEQARLLAQKYSEQAIMQFESIDKVSNEPFAAIEAPNQAATTIKGADEDKEKSSKKEKKKKGKKEAVVAEGADQGTKESTAAAIEAPYQTVAVTEAAGEDTKKSKKKKKRGEKDAVIADGADDDTTEPASVIDAPKQAEAANQGFDKDEGKSKKKKKKDKAKKEALNVEDVVEEAQELAAAAEAPKEPALTAKGKIQDAGKPKKKDKKTKKDRSTFDTTETNEAALPTANDPIPEAGTEPVTSSAEKHADKLAINGEAKEGEQPSKKSKKRKMDKGKKEKGAYTNGITNRLVTDSNQKEWLVSEPNLDAKLSNTAQTKAFIETGDSNNKRREKYIPPTHRKMQARADFARNNPELHRAQRNAKKVQERAERRTRKEEKAQKRYEKRKQRREQSENDRAKAAAIKRAMKVESGE